MKSRQKLLILSACLSAMGLTACSDGGGNDAGSGGQSPASGAVQQGSGDKSTPGVQAAAGSKDGAEVQTVGGDFGPPGSTYVSPVEQKGLEEWRRRGPTIENTEVELHVINIGEGRVRLDGLKSVELCGETGCQPLSLKTSAESLVNATRDGSSLALGSTTLKADTFTHLKVRLRDANGKDREQEVKFREPLQARLMAPKMKALLAIQGVGDCNGDNCLKAVSAASLPAVEGAEYVYYNPVAGSVRKVGEHVALTLPPGAAKDAEIFAINVHDTGAAHPQVHVLPRLNLHDRMKVEVSSFADAQQRLKSYGMEERSLKSVQPKVLEVANPVELVDGMSKVDAGSADPKSLVKKADVSECVGKLRQEANGQLWGWVDSGNVYYHPYLCQDIAPNIHIAITSHRSGNRGHDVVFSDYRENHTRTHVTANSEYTIDLGPGVRLKRVDSYDGFDVIINGFLWDSVNTLIPGVSGVIGDVGRPQGYVHGLDVANVRRITIGNNTNRDGSPDGLKRVVAFGADQSHRETTTLQGPKAQWGEDNPVVLSSATSIIKDGRCEPDEERDRWSAVGFTDQGQVVFVSSTGGGETTVSELCEIFSALNVTQAIRMDGGTAASMAVNGRLVNPLTSLLGRVLFDGGRHVAWAFGARTPWR